jgi:hypothetical protein
MRIFEHWFSAGLVTLVRMTELRIVSSKLVGIALIAVGVAAACSANKSSTNNRNGMNPDGTGASGGMAPLNTGGNTVIVTSNGGANGGAPAVVLTDCSAAMPCHDLRQNRHGRLLLAQGRRVHDRHAVHERYLLLQRELSHRRCGRRRVRGR